jgi:hypothetical protein
MNSTGTPIYTPASRLDATPAPASVSVILMPGGDGVLALDASGNVTSKSGNFLIRSANEFMLRGANVVMLDVAPGFPSGIGYTARLGTTHRASIQTAVNTAFTRWAKPVWIVGTSNSGMSAINAGTSAAAAGGNMLNLTGVVLTSTVTDLVGGGSTQGAQDTFNAYRAALTRPTMVLAHASDACTISSSAGSTALYNAIPATTKILYTFPVGTGHSVISDVCGGFSWHGYAGLEAAAVTQIMNFILANSVRAPAVSVISAPIAIHSAPTNGSIAAAISGRLVSGEDAAFFGPDDVAEDRKR